MISVYVVAGSWSVVLVDAVGVGHGEFGEGLIPVRRGLAFDESAEGFAFVRSVPRCVIGSPVRRPVALAGGTGSATNCSLANRTANVGRRPAVGGGAAIVGHKNVNS
jgi:hypothetical protein